MHRPLTALVLIMLGSGCATLLPPGRPMATKKPMDVYQAPSPPSSHPPTTNPRATLIKNATLMTATGTTLASGFILFKDGRITALGEGDAPSPEPGTHVIDGTGKYVTPGLIDTHSHMGVYASPRVKAHADGNEMVHPTTPYVWAEHSFWPQDPNLRRALAGGVTTVQILPGSGNLIGGRSFVAKLRPHTSAREMRFPNAPQGLKIACGENPKRFYGNRGGPKTRMGNIAAFRKAFQSAFDYRRRLQVYQRDLEHWKATAPTPGNGGDDPPEPPTRDPGLETLVEVLEGRILVHNHCYRADDMHRMLDISEEFGFKIRSFHHALEAYKLAGRLAEQQVASSTWADWWGFKMEALDGVPQNAALLTQAGARAIIHSDSSTDIRHLNQEAAKAQTAGHKIGIALGDEEVLKWITAHPAWALGIEDQVGTLEAGKMADVVLWSRHPLSVYALVDNVWIDGFLTHDRSKAPRVSDFEVGLYSAEVPR